MGIKLGNWVSYLILISGGIILHIYQAHLNIYIPYDDAYSATMIYHSFADIVSITALDVHPPLYYCALKIYSLFAGHTIFALRIFSVMGVVAVMLLGCFPIRRMFGRQISLFFIGIVIFYPVTQNMAIDIRMYSWCAFFTLACALFACDAHEQGRGIDWVKFALMAICAVFTHNYGLLAVVGICLILGINIIVRKKNRDRTESFKMFAASVSIILLAYIPWFYQLLGQMQNVAANYWIKPLTMNDIFLHIYYFYSPKILEFPFVYFSKTAMILGLILVMLSQLLVFVGVVRYTQDKRLLMMMSIIFAMFLFPILFGFVFSFAVFPVLVPRYMTCTFPLFALALSILFGMGWKVWRMRIIVIVSFALLIFNGLARHYVCVLDYRNVKKMYKQMDLFVSGDDMGEAIFVAAPNFAFAMGRMSWILPDNKFFVWDSNKSKNSYAPFLFQSIDLEKELPSQFIFVGHTGGDNREKLELKGKQLENSYIRIDTLCTNDIVLHKMMLRK